MAGIHQHAQQPGFTTHQLPAAKANFLLTFPSVWRGSVCNAGLWIRLYLLIPWEVSKKNAFSKSRHSFFCEEPERKQVWLCGNRGCVL